MIKINSRLVNIYSYLMDSLLINLLCSIICEFYLQSFIQLFIKMSQKQLALSNPELKFIIRNNDHHAQSPQANSYAMKTLGKQSRTKEYQGGVLKHKKSLNARSSQNQFLVHTQGNMQSQQKKKLFVSPKHNQFTESQVEQSKLLFKRPGYSKDYLNVFSPHSHHKQYALTSETKARKNTVAFRKDSLNSNIQSSNNLSNNFKSKMNSPKSFQSFEQSHKNQIISSKIAENINTQIQLLKRSKYLENQRNDDQDLKQINLKQTVSTNSSNKSAKQLKITDFELGRDLGKGKFGNVKIAKHRKTGMVFSLKIINKLMIKQDKIIDQLIKQTKIQSFLNHSHIVKLYAVFDDSENIYLLMELCSQGNLYEYLQKKGKISEQETSDFMRQTCQAVGELHFHKIIHRDIKPQNIVMCFGMVKICDFGWSTEIKGTMRETFCGSPLYISPQLLEGRLYDQKVDLWALGILGYQMMTGTIPFQIITQRDLVKIVNSKIVYPSWMSPLAISFLKQLLEKNPSNRTSAEELLEHPFLCKRK